MSIKTALYVSLSLVAACTSAFSQANVPQTDCDKYAASIIDDNRKGAGVARVLIDPALAIPACIEAVRSYPNAVRFWYQLGRAYEKNSEFQEAFKFYHRAAEQGYSSAQLEIGHLYRDGRGVRKDEAQAVSWYRKAAEQGNVGAQMTLGLCYQNGQGVPKDLIQAAAWYKKAAEGGYEPAKNQLAFISAPRTDGVSSAAAPLQAPVIYGSSSTATPNNGFVAAPRNFEQRSDQSAQYQTAQPSQDNVSPTDCDKYAGNPLDPRIKGSGVAVDKIDPNVAIRACTDALSRYPTTTRFRYQLGRAYYSKKDYVTALEIFRGVAEQGDMAAQTNLAIMYRKGEGVPEDAAQAVAWYRKAADQEYAVAQTNLGEMYRDGEGVKKDEAQALVLFRKAADQGSALAQTRIGAMYENGQGVPKDAAQALS